MFIPHDETNINRHVIHLRLFMAPKKSTTNFFQKPEMTNNALFLDVRRNVPQVKTGERLCSLSFKTWFTFGHILHPML